MEFMIDHISIHEDERGTGEGMIEYFATKIYPNLSVLAAASTSMMFINILLRYIT